MTAGVAWLECTLDDPPDHDDWLTPAEAQVLDELRTSAVTKRVADWRLGRWTVKHLLGLELGLDPSEAGARVAVLADDGGVPRVWLDGERSQLPVSFSHRAGRSLAVVAPVGSTVGCDLELVEPRSDAFVTEWLAPDEQAFVARQPAIDRRAVAANLVWTAKEAAAKLWGEGLRLDVRRAVVSVEAPLPAEAGDGAVWRALSVDCPSEGAVVHGWWREAGGFVRTVVAAPPAGTPVEARTRATR